MAGYSGTPLPKKLGIKDEQRLALIHAPRGFATTLGKLPAGVKSSRDMRGRAEFDVIVAFYESRRLLETEFARLARRLRPAGGLWIAWPKNASGVATDVTESVVRGAGLAGGLVDNKICAVDETWSGLRFVIRLKDR
ncbi:MAG: DUF3052 domain-containing protein [bacterium]|nr:DUF3052 domain-containing protein [bacterium]